MQTVEEFKNEETLNKKIRQKRRIRGVLIVVNALLIAYASYLSVVSIIDAVKHNKDKELQEFLNIISTRRLRSSVMAWLPEKDRQVVKLPLTKEQDRYALHQVY